MSNYWEFHRDKEFKGKVKYEMQAAAIAIMAEVNTTLNHTERVIYANKVLDGSASVVEFCIGVITNSTIKTHIIAGTDYTADLAFVVQGMFNAFAGIAL